MSGDSDCGGMGKPMSQKRDLGHPALVRVTEMETYFLGLLAMIWSLILL
jgi:hypothetical protein